MSELSEMREPFVVTPIYDVLLRGNAQMPIGLYHLQVANAEQLCRLHYSPGSIKVVKARLKTLADNGYVHADSVPTKRMRSPYYYTIGPEGMRYLEETGVDIHDAWRSGKEVDRHAFFLAHTLEINDILIAAALLHRGHGRYSLDHFLHERVLKRQPYKATWRSERGKQAFTIIPDAFLDFRLAMPDGSQRRMPVLLEHDRGTEEQQHFRRRVRAYIMLLKSGAYQELFHSRALTIAFTTFLSTQRREQMRSWTRQEFAATNEPSAIGLSFYFAALPRPLLPEQAWLSPCWYGPYAESEPVALLAAS